MRASSILILLVFVCSGCVVRHGDFTVLSNRVVRLSEFDLSKADRVTGVRGKSVRHIILCVPVGAAPDLEAALDNAFEKGGGDVMTDAVVDRYFWYFPFIYGQSGWRVRGDVVKTRAR